MEKMLLHFYLLDDENFINENDHTVWSEQKHVGMDDAFVNVLLDFVLAVTTVD